MRRHCGLTLLSVCLAQLALGANVIELWGPGADPNNPDHYVLGTHYWVDQEYRTVRILQGSNPDIPWYFQAYDDVTGDPGIIDVIEIAPTGPVGVVHLSVIGNPAQGHQHGAADVKRIDLYWGADDVTRLEYLDITGDYGEYGPMYVGGAGTLSIGGDVRQTLYISDDVTGPVTIGGELQAGLYCDSLQDLTISGTDPVSGTAIVWVRGGYSATMELHHSLYQLNIQAELAGEVSSPGSIQYFDCGPVSGELSLGEDLWDADVNGDVSGTIDVKGRLGQADPVHGLSVSGWIAGVVRMHQPLEGNIWCTHALDEGGLVEVQGDCSGLIHFGSGLAGDVDVWGDLQDGGRIENLWHDASGTVTVQGSMLPGSEFQLGDPFWPHTSELTGEVDIKGDMQGSVLFWGDVGGEGIFAVSGSALAPGTIDVGNQYNLFATDGVIAFGSDVSSDLKLYGGLGGSLKLGGALLDDAAVQLGYPDSGPGLTGSVEVGTEMAGYIQVFGDVVDGHIIIDGPFSGSIYVHGAFAGQDGLEFITVDYDGWDTPDRWEYGAWVHVGSAYYFSAPNDPDIRVWEVTCQKGDLNNSGQVNAADIDPFILALTDPDDYGTTWSGLAGSRIYHGNCNCDYDQYGQPLFDAYDIDPFILRLTNPPAYYAAYPGCEECPAPDNFEQSPPNDDDSSSPAAVAALLRDNVAPERLPVVIEIAAELASAYADTPRGEFWAAVLAELE
jgi:hypothetical protein